jgi:hypothetical protein
MIYELSIGRRKTGVSFHPDSKWPKMWRVHHGDKVSDMVNLTRAKDAAISWALSGSGGGLGSSKVIHWHRREAGGEAA